MSFKVRAARLASEFLWRINPFRERRVLCPAAAFEGMPVRQRRPVTEPAVMLFSHEFSRVPKQKTVRRSPKNEFSASDKWRDFLPAELIRFGNQHLEGKKFTIAESVFRFALDHIDIGKSNLRLDAYEGLLSALEGLKSNFEGNAPAITATQEKIDDLKKDYPQLERSLGQRRDSRDRNLVIKSGTAPDNVSDVPEGPITFLNRENVLAQVRQDFIDGKSDEAKKKLANLRSITLYPDDDISWLAACTPVGDAVEAHKHHRLDPQAIVSSPDFKKNAFAYELDGVIIFYFTRKYEGHEQDEEFFEAQIRRNGGEMFSIVRLKGESPFDAGITRAERGRKAGKQGKPRLPILQVEDKVRDGDLAAACELVARLLHTRPIMDKNKVRDLLRIYKLTEPVKAQLALIGLNVTSPADILTADNVERVFAVRRERQGEAERINFYFEKEGERHLLFFQGEKVIFASLNDLNGRG